MLACVGSKPCVRRGIIRVSGTAFLRLQSGLSSALLAGGGVCEAGMSSVLKCITF